MERINLNVPSDLRASLRQLARQRRRNESALARELLAKAIEDAQREEFYRRVAAEATPAALARDVEIAESFLRFLAHDDAR